MDLTVDEFQSYIQNTYVKPSYERDVKDFNESRYEFRKSGYKFEKYGKYLACLSVLLNFVFTGIPEFKYGGLIAGGIGLLGITSHGLGSWAVTKSSEANDSLNKTYKGMGLSIIMPDVIPKNDGEKQAVESKDSDTSTGIISGKITNVDEHNKSFDILGEIRLKVSHEDINLINQPTSTS